MFLLTTGRTILAFLAAPLITPLVFLMVSLIWKVFSPNYPITLPFDLTLYLVIAVYAYVVTAIFGVPAFFVFRALRLSSAVLFAVAGALIGFAVSLILMHSHPLFGFWILLDRAAFTLAGALSAFTFSLLLFKRDSDHRPLPNYGET